MTHRLLLSKYPNNTVELALQAQSLILGTLPGILEMPDEKANIIGYGYSHQYLDNICNIILSKKGIKIGFYKGAELPDPSGLLAGTGKMHKYIQINEPQDLRNTAVKILLKEGLKAWKKRTSS